MRSPEQDRLLTRRELALIVLGVLPIFCFWAGPVWRHPFQIDSAVYLSYAPIPLLVVAALLRRHVLSLAGFFVNTIWALSVKYMITTSAAFLLWAVFDPPVLAHPPIEQRPNARAPSETAPHAYDDAALVVFDSREISPSRIELTGDQSLAFRAIDGSLHTLRAKREDGSIAFNLPVIPGRASKPVSLRAARGTIELSCAVHAGEKHAMVIVR